MRVSPLAPQKQIPISVRANTTTGISLNNKIQNLPAVKSGQNTSIDPDSVLGKITQSIDIRALSPRQMGELSLDLYATGVLSFDDYSELAFQAELHPDYNKTIGALTGNNAEPDKGKDYIKGWTERLRFDLRHSPENREIIDRSIRILALLRRIDQPTDITT